MSAFNANDFMYNCTCVRGSPTRPEMYPLLSNLLPRRCDEGVYSYIVCDYIEPASNQFIVRFRLNCGTKDAAKQWLENFSYLGKTTYRLSQTFPEDSDRVLYKVRLHCHHNTQPRSHHTSNPHKKHTGCPARITLTVKQRSIDGNTGKMTRSKDCHLPEHPMVVILHHRHNHTLNTAESLKYRKPTQHIREKFMQLFQSGLNPSSALEIYRQSLFEENEEQYYQMTSDRGILPDIQWVFRQYYNVFKKKHGDNYWEDMLAKLMTFIAEYNDLNDGDYISLERLDNDRDFIIVIITPVMKRTLEFVTDTADTMYIDSFGGEDKYGMKNLILMSNSCAGPLPLCVIISTVRSEEATRKSLFLFQSMLNENSFACRGYLGPAVIFTDDSTIMQKSLKSCFTQATILVSSYHVLRGAWKCITSLQSSVLPSHRTHLFNSIKQMVFSESESNLAAIYNGLSKSETLGEYSKVRIYLKKIYARKHDWASCYLYNLPSSHHTNICNEAIAVLKERLLSKAKMFTADQLVHYVVEDLNQFYQTNLLDLAKTKMALSFKSRYNYSDEKLRMLTCRRLKDLLFEVFNSVTNETYIVDMLTECCNCDASNGGSFCKHLYYTSKNFAQDFKIKINASMDDRKLIYLLATGDAELSDFSQEDVLCEQEDEDIAKDVFKEEIVGPKLVEEEQDIFAKVAFDREARWEDNFRSVQSEFRSVCADIENKSFAMKDVEMLSKFIKNYRKLRTHQALSAACCSFAKQPGVKVDGKRRLEENVVQLKKRGRPRKIRATDEETFYAVTDGTVMVPQLNNIQQIFSVQISDNVHEYITSEQLNANTLYLN